ncbi:2-methylcitrate dehydratase [Amycolatopsis antarctica]|uniref:2-methylcitrate dehydratase n=1 Tax=Amycolatopsis antarctica TaxID=1854586 RepID=A0A263CWB9_9PSEU|nr:MmgE/PrpD family protein [Amycolatopsis antarctica]OZM70440.1 2-methylcitrate dehydratase [Amycolatopsis antarctica]
MTTTAPATPAADTGTGTAAQRLGAFTAGLRHTDLPAEVVTAARLHVLDTLGCGIAALALGEAAYAVAGADEAGTAGPAAALGVPHGLPAAEAAFVNGVLCHALDFDDTHPDSVIHVSAAVTPAAFAAGQAAGADGATVLAAIVAGNEVSTRVGAAAGGQFHARGLHPSGVCGVFGATAAAARARGLDADRTAQALGIAGSMASGLLEFLADGADTKRLHPGWAAQAGITATRLAAHGARGPATVFEGVRGFYATYLHGIEVDLAPQLDTLGQSWNTPSIAYKPYPACHYTHAPVDALAGILRDNPSLRAADVASMVAYTDATGVGLVLEPAADKARPRTPYDAKFSLPFCLASLLVHGTVDVASFTPDRIADEAVLALSRSVSYEQRTYSPRPDAFGGGVRVLTTDGRTFEAELRYQRGGAENPMTEADVLDKYRANAGLVLGEDGVRALERDVTALQDHTDLGFLAVVRG